MRARQGAAGPAFDGAVLVENVECVFDDVVPGCAGNVQKELSTKLRQSKPLAYFPTVENDGARRRLTVLAPFGQDPAVIGEQRHPTADLAGAVPRPVIRRNQPGVQAAGIAEKGKVRGEIQWI